MLCCRFPVPQNKSPVEKRLHIPRKGSRIVDGRPKKESRLPLRPFCGEYIHGVIKAVMTLVTLMTGDAATNGFDADQNSSVSIPSSWRTSATRPRAVWSAAIFMGRTVYKVKLSY